MSSSFHAPVRGSLEARHFVLAQLDWKLLGHTRSIGTSPVVLERAQFVHSSKIVKMNGAGWKGSL